jgi:hypothetical protein
VTCQALVGTVQVLFKIEEKKRNSEKKSLLRKSVLTISFLYYFLPTAHLFFYVSQIIVRNVHTRRGLLMLVPEAVEILGGVVDELEAARARLVSEVNKPPRGKRYTWYTSEVMYT